MMIRIKKGLDLPITGAPAPQLEEKPVTKVAVMGSDYPGLKPVLLVEVGEQVKRGQPLFSDKGLPGVQFTAPAGGVVSAIERGERRTLQAIEIAVNANEEELEFNAYRPEELGTLSTGQVRTQLLGSGLWTSLRTRPFSRVPAADAVPHAIFVTAMDSNPLAADPQLVLRGREQDFLNGLAVLTRLGPGPVHVCRAAGSAIPTSTNPSVLDHEFAGPHPAGLAGTHIHFIAPAGEHRSLWHLNYQDTIAIGRLFTEGRLCVERVIALGGPQVQRPRLLRTRRGASLDELTAGELRPGPSRIVSGSALCGRKAEGALAYLGPYHLQVTALQEGGASQLLGWLRPGSDRFSVLNLYASRLFRHRRFAFATGTGGETRPMVPVGSYEAVMPLDILPTQLLRALIVGDTDLARQLGCLELDEEDLALCTFVCPGKYDYAPLLRAALERIEKEG